jgi:hypothetical protein
VKRYSCKQCRTGHVPGTPKTFDPDCPGCRQKLAAGLRTGNEPRLAKGGLRGTIAGDCNSRKHPSPITETAAWAVNQINAAGAKDAERSRIVMTVSHGPCGKTSLPDPTSP